MNLTRFIHKVWPKNSKSDQAAFMVTHVGLIGAGLFEIFLVLPRYHEPFAWWYLIHSFFALFFAFNVFGNMYKMILIDTTVKSEQLRLPSVLRPGWFYCPNCRMNSPPRAHHCPICDVCVIKRDHHCIFTGNCVGYHNHRYFFCMALYLCIGCIYLNAFNYEFYREVLGEFHLSTVVRIVFPMVAWTFGYINAYELGISIVAGVTFMALFLFLCLFGFQVYFITRGQTQFECKKKIRDYSDTLYNNFVLVLGKQWYLTLLCPYFSSQLLGDGTEFIKSPQETKEM